MEHSRIIAGLIRVRSLTSPASKDQSMSMAENWKQVNLWLMQANMRTSSGATNTLRRAINMLYINYKVNNPKPTKHPWLSSALPWRNAVLVLKGADTKFHLLPWRDLLKCSAVFSSMLLCVIRFNTAAGFRAEQNVVFPFVYGDSFCIVGIIQHVDLIHCSYLLMFLGLYRYDCMPYVCYYFASQSVLHCHLSNW